MKNSFFKIKMLILVLSLVGLASCTSETRELKLSTVDNVLQVEAGGSIQFETNLKVVIEYQITSNADKATITSSGLLEVDANTTPGTQIKVIAKYGDLVSNEVTVTVTQMPEPEKLLLYSDAVQAKPGGSIVFTTNLAGATFKVVAGTNYATLNAATGLLTVKADAQPGAKITIAAVLGALSSNEIEITVIDIPLEALVVTASSNEVMPGTAIVLTAIYSPGNTTQKDIVFEITNNYSDASIVGNILNLDENASLGEIIIKAKRGDVVSNEITIAVVAKAQLLIVVENGITSIAPGEDVQLSTNLVGATYQLLTGADMATITADGLLVVNQNATPGSIITIVAYLNELVSLEVELLIEEIELERITIGENTKNTAIPGETIAIAYDLYPTNVTQKNLVWEIIKGGIHAEIIGNQLFIKATAVPLAQIEIVAKSGDIVSNVFTVTVVEAPVLTLSSDKLEVQPNESIELTTSELGASIEIISGADKATLNGNLLTINADTLPGTEIILVAKFGLLTSEELIITVVDIELVSISASAATSSTFPGSAVNLVAILNPENTTQTNVVWVLRGTYDSSIKIIGNVLEIGANAPLNTNVVLYAKVGDIISNDVTVRIEAPSADDLYVEYPEGSDTYLIENNGVGSEFVITVNVTNADGYTYPNANVVFEVIEGQSIISIIAVDGYSCYIRLEGHGTAIVRAKVNDKTEPAIINVKAIKTPSVIYLSDYLGGKDKIDYKVGINQPFTFTGVVRDQTACQEVEYIFKNLSNGEIGNAVGTFDESTNTITLKQIGEIEVTVSSLSYNSNGEIKQKFVFQTNNGVNVHTWEQFKSAAQNAANANKAINIIVTEKLNGYNSFDIVPLGIVNNSFDLNSLIAGDASITITNSLTINGNSHVINLKNLRKFDLTGANGPIFRSVFLVHLPSQTTGTIVFNDTIIEGNVTLDGVTRDGSGDRFDTKDTTGKLAGVHRAAIEIGHNWYGEDELGGGVDLARYNVIINNVKVNYFMYGIRIDRALEGSYISDASISNCYINGLDVSGSVINLNNMEFGTFGAAALDINEYGSRYAGEGYGNINQKVTFTGTFISGNTNNLQTRYLREYQHSGQSVSTIIGTVIAGIDAQIQAALNALPYPQEVKNQLKAELMSNLYKDIDGGEVFNFAVFKFNGIDGKNAVPNQSHMEFYNEINMISIEEHLSMVTSGSATAVNTTHQFISFPIPNVLGGNGELARIFVINPNYGK